MLFEIHCYMQENDLLVAQQTQLDGEIQRLRAQLEQQTAVMVGASQEQALAMARAQQQAAECQVGGIGGGTNG